MAPFGGWSVDLKEHQLGLNREHLESTELVPFEDKVTLKKLESRETRPLFYKKWFHLVPLDKDMPDAYRKSLKGEVVLPSHVEHSWLKDINEGEYVILNNVLGKRLGEDPLDWDNKLLADVLSDLRF
ncbi:MAG: hypothetical protein V3T58_06320 [Candidatus Hydrothermarchaeales archaeon]